MIVRTLGCIQGKNLRSMSFSISPPSQLLSLSFSLSPPSQLLPHSAKEQQKHF